MEAQLWMGLAFVTGAIALSAWGGVTFVAARRNGTVSYLQSGSPVIRIHSRGPASTRERRSTLATLGARLTSASRRERMTRLAERAGGADLVERAMTVKVLGLCAAVLTLWLASPVLALLTAAAAWFGPELRLGRKAEARAGAIRRSLPDFLDLLAISVEAGAGLDSAMARAAGEVGGPLGDEFHRLLHALGLGSSRREAFIALKERAQVRELSSFVLALLQAEALGISLAGVLRTQATEMRAVRRRLAREQAARAPVKILFPLVFGIFPALMLVVLGPAAIRIMQTLVAG